MHTLKPIKTSEKKILGEVLLDKEEDQEPLSPMARLFHQPESNVYIIVMVGFKTPINPHEFKEMMARTLLKHPRFSSLQVMDEKRGNQMKWVRAKEVNLDNHVVFPEINPNMDSSASADKYLENYVSELTKSVIDVHSKPMWDLHLLNLRTSDAESVAVLRVHHSLGDGTSLMSLFLSCARSVKNPQVLPAFPTRKTTDGSKSFGVWRILLRFWSVMLLLRNSFIDVVMFAATRLFLKDTETPLKGSLGVGATPRRIIRRTVSLDDVKLVKNAMGTTINDVAVGVAQAGLSRYLNRRYGKGADNLPKNIRLRATLFFNIRPSPGLQAFVDMMEKGTKGRWGNEIGYVLFPFKIALREDPLDYVREAKAAMDRKKASLESKFTYFINNFSLKFGIKAGGFPSQTTLWFSNVVGPDEEITLNGHPVSYVAPTCYGQPNALMIHVVSYANKLSFVLSADEGTVPNPHQLCDDIEQSLGLIKKAVIAKGLVKNMDNSKIHSSI